MDNEIYDYFLANLRKYKTAFTTRLHPNLWQDHAEGYRILSIDAYKAYVEGSRTDTSRMVFLQECLREYSCLFNIKALCFENRYTHKAVTQLKPQHIKYDYGLDQFKAYRANAYQHLQNREMFYYEWKTKHCVSVNGVLGDDGVYRAYLNMWGKVSLTYYLLNETSAVLMEGN